MNKPADPVKPEEPKGPWWRVGMMWLVVGGPLIVVLACAATLTLALKFPDPVLDVRQEASADVRQSPSDVPALKARNHAATGGQ